MRDVGGDNENKVATPHSYMKKSDNTEEMIE